MPYQPSSMVLFLTNCSLTKEFGGSAEYDEAQAITSVLAESLGNRLLKRRASAFQAVKKGADFDWQGTPVSELEYNRELTSGPDLGGRHTANYLPALNRYQGRFFKALGVEGKQRLVESEHHTLFLSGLYGLLRPTEPVQLYSCPLAPPVAELWRKDALLTDILCDYVERFEIALIIDLTAIDAYRQLIDWNKVAETKTDVLHGFDVMAAGESALVFFGECMAEQLLGLSADEIIGLPSEHRLGTVILRSLREAVAGLPSERADTDKPSPDSPPGDDKPAVDGREQGHGRWRPEFERPFVKSLRSRMITGAMQAIVKICEDPMTPRGDTIKPLKGQLLGKWRYRLGDYRIVYRPDRHNRWVVFESFESRGKGYKK